MAKQRKQVASARKRKSPSIAVQKRPAAAIASNKFVQLFEESKSAKPDKLELFVQRVQRVIKHRLDNPRFCCGTAAMLAWEIGEEGPGIQSVTPH